MLLLVARPYVVSRMVKAAAGVVQGATSRGCWFSMAVSTIDTELTFARRGWARAWAEADQAAQTSTTVLAGSIRPTSSLAHRFVAGVHFGSKAAVLNCAR